MNAQMDFAARAALDFLDFLADYYRGSCSIIK